MFFLLKVVHKKNGNCLFLVGFLQLAHHFNKNFLFKIKI
jgi:hypothetical protein